MSPPAWFRRISVTKAANPLSLPAPGGTFTFTAQVNNPSAVDPVKITALVDNIYGDLATRPGSTCVALIGTTLAPSASSAPCSFTGPFTGVSGASQTDTVTVTGVDSNGTTVTATANATVTLTAAVVPQISVIKVANPLSLPAPGGTFTFTAQVNNPSAVDPVKITALVDNIYGDLATRPGSTCVALIGTTLAPSASSAPCSFTGPFTGVSGASQTDTVTVTGVDSNGTTVTATANATVTLTSPKASPTIATTASPGNLLGAPVHDTATVSAGSGPTGSVTFRLFSDAACATQVFTSTNPLGAGTATSDNFTPTAAGTYYWTAAYSGDTNNNAVTSPCGAANESVVIAPFTPPAPTRTITGDFVGPVTVNAGESVLITNARVVGPVTVNPGGALTVVNSQISQGIVANGPSFFSVCGSQVSGPSTTPGQGIVVSNASVPIRIGDPAAGCAFNRVAGDVVLTGNTAGLTLGSNIVSGNVTVNNNTVGTDVIKANNIFKTLACSGNNPPPVNASQPNTAASKSGQCSAL